ANRARAAPGAGGRAAFRRARDRRLGAVQPCALRPRPRRPPLGRARERAQRLSALLWVGARSEPYAFRSLLDSGAVLANGSDAPIEELDPLLGIRAGVARTLDEREAWHTDPALHARPGA